MFQFPGFASALRQMTGVTTSRVSPFGHRWIADCVRLPSAFRSLPRPSSPLCAQASPTRLRSLDHKFVMKQSTRDLLVTSDSFFVRPLHSREVFSFEIEITLMIRG
jgi:hypothetical protein